MSFFHLIGKFVLLPEWYEYDSDVEYVWRKIHSSFSSWSATCARHGLPLTLISAILYVARPSDY